MENATQVGDAIFSRSLGPFRDRKLKSKLGTCSFFKDKVTANRASREHLLKRHRDLPGTIYLSFALLGMKYHIKRQVGMR